MAAAHLISGLPGAGKTTYATRLSAGIGGVQFTLDRWLITTFGRYSIDDVGSGEHVRRVLACRELIWTAGVELLRRGVDTVLDDGFFLREHRMRVVGLAAGIGSRAAIHYVDTPLEIVRARLARRNQALPAHNFVIDPALLDDMLRMFEAPATGEGAEIVMVTEPAVEATRR